jgi:DNA invertase Pin-like site-specific DNA recombinase
LYAQRNNIRIVKYYGGTNESAKTEGKLYKEMITEIAKTKGINIILVYSFDRFPRAGDEGILTKRYLKSKGIYVVSALRLTHPNSSAGEFTENILFLFNQFENNLRKGKCEAGMKETLEKGLVF